MNLLRNGITWLYRVAMQPGRFIVCKEGEALVVGLRYAQRQPTKFQHPQLPQLTALQHQGKGIARTFVAVPDRRCGGAVVAAIRPCGGGRQHSWLLRADFGVRADRRPARPTGQALLTQLCLAVCLATLDRAFLPPVPGRDASRALSVSVS